MPAWHNFALPALLWAAAILFAAPAQPAGPVIVIGPRADPLERYAAEELGRYIANLFGVKAIVTNTETCANGANCLYLGTPEHGPAVLREALAGHPLSDQGISLRTERTKGRTSLIVAGGSPRAVLWAVSELAEHWGVRFRLSGDLFPQGRRRFRIPDLDLVLEPRLRVRQWRLVNEFASGPSSWGIEQLRPFVDQLAKLRFNRLLLWTWPHQPFLDYEYGGVHRRSATMNFGFRYPITPDMIGRSLFGAERFFSNPDIPVDAPYAEQVQAGIRHIRALIQHGKSRGMQIVIPAHLTEFPPEFAPVLTDSQTVRQVGSLTVIPGASVRFDDERLRGLAEVILRKTIETYPEADYIAFSMPEHRQWLDDYPRAWSELDHRHGLSKVTTADALLAQAGARKDFHGGRGRAEAEVKGDLVNVRFYEQFMQRFPERPFVLDGVAEELYPILDKVLPARSELLNFVDYTPSRVLRRREALSRVPARTIPSVLIYTLHDDNVGLLPQLATHSLHELTQTIQPLGWAGFSTRYWLLGDQETCVAYLAKAAWKETSPDEVAADYWNRIAGARTVDPMAAALRHLEKATELLEWNALGFAFPLPDMVTKHWNAEELPPVFDEITRQYEAARKSLPAPRSAARREGQERLKYWDQRLRFGIEYLDGVREIRRAARSEVAGSRPRALAHAHNALARFQSALEAYASVASDRSDAGSIAVMNEHVYRALRKKIADMETSQ